MKIYDIKKIIGKIVALLAVAVLLELLVFNFTELSILMNPSLEKNISYTLVNMEKVNWKKNNESIISNLDPMLILSDINKEVRTVKISVEANEPIESSTIFYTNSQLKYFSEKGMVIAKGGQGVLSISLNNFVKDLRIDVTEKAGLVLSNITVVINPVKIQISFSRIIAVILIYLGTVILFNLQKNPDYQIDQKNNNLPRRD